MIDGDGSDPFFWQVDRLVQELCTPNRSWKAPPPNKLPDPAILAAQVREHELNGEVLLTYEDSGGREAFDSLCRDLGIKKIIYKASFHDAIRQFQSRSQAYRRWKERHLLGDSQLSEHGPSGGDALETASPSDEVLGGGAPVPEPPSHALLNGNADPTGGSADGAQSRPDAARNGPASEDDLGPPRKRKRLAPTNISSAPLQPQRGEIPTEADVFTTTLDEPLEELWRPSAEGAYLGHWKLEKESILSTRESLSSSSTASHEFGFALPKPIPPGRRLQTNQILSGYLRPQKSQLNLGRARGGRPSSDRVGSGGSTEEGDTLLPAFGDSDSDEAVYDSDTMREIEEEASQRKIAQPLKSHYLTDGEVDAVIAEAIEKVKARWNEKKLPKLERRSHKIWTDARRLGTRKHQIDTAMKKMTALEGRLDNLAKKIRSVDWTKKADVRLQAGSLEATVEDKEEQGWIVRLLSSIAQPKEPTVQQARLASRKQTAIKVRTEDGDEVLTSSSDDDFTSDDDEVTRSDGVLQQQEGYAASTRGTPDPEEETASVRSDINQAVESSSKEKSPAPAEAERSSPIPAEPSNPEAIATRGLTHWQELGDGARLVIAMLHDYFPRKRSRLFDSLEPDGEALWEKFCVRALQKKKPSFLKGTPMDDTALAFTKLFDAFTAAQPAPLSSMILLSEESVQRITSSQHRISDFRSFLLSIAPYFPEAPPATPSKKGGVAERRGEVEMGSVVEVEEMDGNVEAEKDVEMNTNVETEAVAVDEDLGGSSSEDAAISSSQRKRAIRRDKAAQDLRDHALEDQEKQKERSSALRARLAALGTISKDQSRLIINEAKEDDQGLIYINDYIGQRIKDHQIDGVRFMWNQIVADTKVRQGCLLAHTMGLGKTMQVITLLVAIAQAAASEDASIRSQIPSDLAQPKTLVLCPPGLVENWYDELSTWTPDGLLGTFYKIHSDNPITHRIRRIKEWASAGGVLIFGYDGFRKLIQEDLEDVRSVLEESPNVVIADEAHSLKNTESQIHKATQNFRTKSRIAMTGSPLANSVEEYHALIDWIAPNYLANHREFVAVYATPIKEGFYQDSELSQRRRALKLLKVLKETVAPKVHRATIAALKGELPEKKEFVIYLPLTPLQLEAYKVFMQHISQPGVMNAISNNIQLWNLVINLGLLLAHPRVFKTKLEALKSQIERGNNAKLDKADLTAKHSLPPAAISDLIAVVGRRDIDNLEYSCKVLVLLGILDEARKVGDKTLVFSQSKVTLDYLEAVMKRQQRPFSRLDGDTKIQARQAMVKGFNTGRDEVYLISTTAGGVGLNIYGANRVVIFDFKWNPTSEQQAIGRAYRLGQTKPVFVYWLIVGGTYETVLHNQAVFKVQLASRVVDKKNPYAWAQQVKNYTAPPAIVKPDREQVLGYRGQDEVLDALLSSEKHAHHLCRIITADTFEEEEPETKLSAEELKEAADMVRLNQLRSQNPEEYEKLSSVLASQGNKMPQPAPTGPTPGRPAGPSTAPARVVIPPSFWQQGQGLPPSPAQQGPAIRPAAAAADQHASPMPAPAPPGGQTPMEGSQHRPVGLNPHGSFYLGQEVEPPRQIPPPTEARQPGLAGPEAQGPSASAQKAEAIPPLGPASPTKGRAGQRVEGAQVQRQAARDVSGAAKNFRDQMLGHARSLHLEPLLTEGQSLEGLITNMVAKTSSALTERGIKNIVAMSEWSRLAKLASTDPRFVAAVVAGWLGPADIVEASGRGERLVQLRNLSQEAFDQMMQRRGRDPDHIQKNIERGLVRPKREDEDSGPHRTDDLAALQEVGASRKKRLPSWAEQALRQPRGRRDGKATGPPASQSSKAGDAKENPMFID